VPRRLQVLNDLGSPGGPTEPARTRSGKRQGRRTTWCSRPKVGSAPTSGVAHFQKALKPRIAIRGLRYSHASLGPDSGVPLVVMSERLGHSSVVITGDPYSDTLPAQHQEAAERTANQIV
jgi:integrase